MIHPLRSLGTFLLAGLCALRLPAASPPKVAVLGDDPAFVQSFKSDLAARGLSTSDEAGAWDAVLLQASQPKELTESEREILTATAKRGGGIILIHQALAGAAPEFMKPLAGGAWTSHSRKFSSRMMFYTMTDQHSIMAGASPFDITDDAAFDLDIELENKGLTVLGSAFTPKVSSKKGSAPTDSNRANIFDIQPQMWAYEAAGHKAVVLLQGSPETLQHPSMRAFLLRSLAWTTGQAKIDAYLTPPEVTALRYPKDGAQPADQVTRQMELHPDFVMREVASEPLINKPIAIQWDASGRMWIAESVEYPNGRRENVAASWKETGVLQPGTYDRPARDRISILSAPDVSGRFTKKTVWHEDLELVTGFCMHRDGVIAVHQPDIVFIRDTDQDGRADKVERIFTGFTPGDSHFVANHFIQGMDGWIYANMGGDANVKSPDGNHSFGKVISGVFRFKPDGSAIEQVSSKGGNGFGLDITSDGEIFFNQATSGNPIQHVVVPETVLAKGRIGNLLGAESVIKQRKVVRREMPDRAALMQIDVVGGYSAACSSLIYEGGSWPAEWNRSAFTTEPILNILHHEVLSPTGSTFAGEMVRKDAEYALSPDYWFRPFDIACGPDGAAYVLDFYCPVVAHSDSRGPQHSKSGASVRPDRDHYFGRVYRIDHKDAIRLVVPDLAKARSDELAQALKHPNKVVRENALRLLCEQGGAHSSAALTGMIASSNPTASRVAALWGLHRLGTLDQTALAAALADPDPALRKNAALIIEAGATPPQGSVAHALGDKDIRVAIAMLRALAVTGLDDEAARQLTNVVPTLPDDWARSAAVAAASQNPLPVLKVALESSEPQALASFVTAVASKLPEGHQAGDLIPLLQACANAPDRAAPLVQEIVSAARLLTAPASPSTEVTATLRALLTSKHPSIRAAALPLTVAWRADGPLHEVIQPLVQDLLKQLASAEVPLPLRMDMATALCGARAADPAILPAMGSVLATNHPEALKRHVLTQLGSLNDAAAGQLMVLSFNHLAASLQPSTVDLLLTRSDWTMAFLDAVEKKEISINLLGPATLFKLRTHPAKEVAARANQMLEQLRAVSKDKDAAIARLVPEVLQRGDATKGQAIFAATCAMCHKFNDLGHEIGPVLTGIGLHGPADLMVHILDPNRQVDANYEVWSFELNDGKFHSGIIANENATEVLVKMPGADVKVAKADIKTRTNTHRSLMPEGYEALGGEILRDLLAYICADTGKHRVLNLTHAFTADTRRGLYQSQEQTGDTLPFLKFGIVNVEGIPFDIMDPEKSSLGGNVIVLKGGPPESFANTLPQRVEIPVGYAAKKLHFLGGVAGWGASKAGERRTAMTVKLTYANGKVDEVDLRDGIVFTDYAGDVEVPGSKFADGLVKNKGLRWFTVPLQPESPLTKVELSSPGGGPAATTVAVTAEL
ncbi:PVC-type heme-binding CxxCH protein [Verrucomicrobium sp. BvORR106]|uniref:PVC-type heme-binding CxxCH protein n=1 Tax=Verrucomicrobium sp. BvORR106 TaxID=1403819 RepID=UPI00056EB36F|nr:PVC-type heme-binding CxxCH protein [Verrucomicrobium sp. BvORR106]